MKLLLVADAEKHEALAREFPQDFSVVLATDSVRAMDDLAKEGADALLVHLGIGESQALDLLYAARKLGSERAPGSVVVAPAFELRSVVEVMRAGAFDVLIDGNLPPGKLAHSVRNAVLNARLSRPRATQSKEVLVIGTGDGADAVVMMLEAVGHTVRHVPQMPNASELKVKPRAIVVDMRAVGDGETLLKLLPAN